MKGYRAQQPRRRTSGQRWSRAWAWWTTALAVGAVTATIAALAASPSMTVRKVIVIMPALPIEAEQRCVRKRAEIRPGTSLALMDVRTYADEIRRLPWVRSVQVRRSLNRAVTVEVEVRRPVVRLVCGGRRWEADDEGVVIRPARRDVELPEIVMLQPRPICLGARVDAEEVLGAIAAVRLSRNMGVLNAVSVTVDQRNGICFNNGDRVAVWLGQAEDLPYKLALVERMYRVEPTIAQRLLSIDVRVPQVPAGTPRITSDAGGAHDSDAG